MPTGGWLLQSTSLASSSFWEGNNPWRPTSFFPLSECIALTDTQTQKPSLGMTET